MNLLFVNTNQTRLPDPVPPIGLSYLASAMRRAQHKCEIFDLTFQPEFEDALKKRILETKVDVIGLSLRNVDNTAYPKSVSYFEHFKQIVRICRETAPETPIVVGGPAFSLFPEEFIEKLGVDYGIAGEGEIALLELLEKLANGEQPEQIIYHAQSGQVNLDHLTPAWDLLETKRYFKDGGSLNIQTKRGCRYKCAYCSYPLLEGSSVRQRSPEKVVDEMEASFHEYGIDYFFFVDNVFNYPREHSVAICNEIIKRKLKVHWTAYTSPGVVDEEMFAIYKEAGCDALDFGSDAMSNVGLASMSKWFTISKIKDASRWCRENEIKFSHSLIFGSPGETKESIEETIANVHECNPSVVIAMIGVRIYPHTPLANRLIKQGWIAPEEIGLKPVFYVEESIREFMFERLLTESRNYHNWILPGFNKKINHPLLFERLRNKAGKSGAYGKGPMWKMLA